MSKHTRGTWDVCYDHPDPVTNPRVAYIRGRGPTRHYNEIAMLYCCDDEKQRANAQLIAAAPDMIDALRQWANAECEGDAQELANARVSRDLAIAKAETGDAP